MPLRILLLLAPLVLVGCGSTQQSPAPPPRAADPSLLEPLLLSEKPAPARGLADVRDTAKDGEEVVLEGQVPPGEGRSFLNDRAGFVLMAKEDIDQNREELECMEPDCPSCAKLLNGKGVQIELVDRSGAVVKSPVKGFRGIGPESTVTVKGTVERKGKKVLVRARSFFVG
jgi:hypothetical protein